MDSVIDLLGTQYYVILPLMGPDVYNSITIPFFSIADGWWIEVFVKAEALWVLYREGGAALATCGQAHVRNPAHLPWPTWMSWSREW